jgi:hypothetical protein
MRISLLASEETVIPFRSCSIMSRPLRRQPPRWVAPRPPRPCHSWTQQATAQAQAPGEWGPTFASGDKGPAGDFTVRGTGTEASCRRIWR